MATQKTFSITQKGNGRLPSLPFARIKDVVLGKRYSLSLAFVPPRESRKLNREYRGKDKPANVLSFPLAKNEGEIVMCMSEAKRQAPEYALSERSFVALLFIHGLFHLKGFRHGSRMEAKEEAARKKFGL